MGRPKTFKTGGVVGTYPTPILYLGFDRGGVDIIPSKAALDSFGSDLIKPRISYEEIKFIKPGGELASWVNKPMEEQPKVLAIQFYEGTPLALTLDTKPSPSQAAFQNFVNDYNSLTMKQVLPWKTIVLDSATGLTDTILNWISSFNPAAMTDARQWAGQAGGKVRQICLSMTSLPCHVVILLHSVTEQNDLTKEINEQPSLYSQTLRDDFFGMFSQVFYSTIDSTGKPKVWPSQRYPVKGIGCRWPVGLPSELAPDFNSIYGKELGAL